jgi:hypothetical protein
MMADDPRELLQQELEGRAGIGGGKTICYIGFCFPRRLVLHREKKHTQRSLARTDSGCVACGTTTAVACKHGPGPLDISPQPRVAVLDLDRRFGSLLFFSSGPVRNSRLGLHISQHKARPNTVPEQLAQPEAA